MQDVRYGKRRAASLIYNSGADVSLNLQAEYYKKRLFYCVSGLDRGSAANSSAAAEVEAAVASLLTVSPPVLLSWAPGIHS